MAISQITALPDPPSRSNPTDFATKADALMNAFPTFVSETNTVASEVEAFANLAVAAGGSATTALSTSELTVGTGSKSLTASAGKQFVPGQPLKLWNVANAAGMVGTVTSYDNGTGALVVNVIAATGSGTFSDWTIFTAMPALTEIPASPTDEQKSYPVTMGAILDSIGDANRMCPLDASSKVPATNLPWALEGDLYSGSTELAMNPAMAMALSVAIATMYGHGECYLYLDGAVLRLIGKDLRRMMLNGVAAVIPVAGITLAAPGVANTLYYIYAYLSSGTVTLEASTTAWTADATTGIPIKTGDATRVLVGMARTTATGAWADSGTQRFVLSYYNKKEKVAQGTLSAEVAISSTTSVELTTNARAYFLTWGDELVTISGNAHPHNNTVGNTVSFMVGIDGATGITYGASVMYSTNAGYRVPTNVSAKGTMLSEGLHFVTPCGYVSGGSASFYTTGDRCTVCTAFIRG